MTNQNDYKGFTEYFKMVADMVTSLDIQAIEKTTEAILKCYKNNGTIFLCGNGGSAATASHICGDFMKGISYGLEKRFKAICLSDNICGMMAVSNDVSYDDIFVEPLKNFLSSNDLLIGFSGSGNSANVVKAVEYAAPLGLNPLPYVVTKVGK